MKLGIFLPTWIGDAAMATPTLRALSQQFGSVAELIGIGRPYLQDLFGGCSWFDRFVEYDPRAKQKEQRTLAVANRLRREGITTAVLMRNSLREALVAYWAGATTRVGYARYGRGPLLTHRLQPPHENGKRVPYRMVDYYPQLAYALGCPPQPSRIELATTDEDEQQATTIWQKLGLQRQVITFNCSGAFGAAKLWPVASFAKLARRVANQLGYDVLVICGPNERERAAEIAQQAEHRRVFSLADFPLSLGLSKACVKRSAAMVTTDSGPRQFAVAFRVPMVTLCGPSHVCWGENPYAQEIALQVPLACVPCQKRVCPLGHHDCMRLLQVDWAYEALLRQLDSQRERRAA